MAEFEIRADVRSDQGKGAVRRLRRTGRIPAIMYGAGKAPLPLELSENVVRRQLSNEAWFSHVLTVKVDGREEQAVIKSLQRHPGNGANTAPRPPAGERDAEDHHARSVPFRA